MQDKVFSKEKFSSTSATQVNTNQHESTRINTSQHKSDTSQHESDTSQHESTEV